MRPLLPRHLERRQNAQLRSCGVLLAGLFLGCAATKQFHLENDQFVQKLDVAQYQQAQRCAAEDLAVAQANQEFAADEYGQGDFFRAREHMDIANAAMARAIAGSVSCAPDTDKDGLHDRIDKCPTVPGPKENQGCPWPDTDKDGLTDNVDKCPTVAGPKENGGCPWGDIDKDGIPDNVDQCPNDPEDKDGFQDDDGCPEPDNDQDGVPDIIDRCPMEKGPAANQGCPVMDSDGDGILDTEDKCPFEPGIPELQGCPPTDRDNDGVPDFIDKCPDEPGLIENQGCPKKYSLVVLRKDRLEIKEQVHFATNKYEILKDSFPLLNEIALLLKDNPKLHIHIDGHTDREADEKTNMKLSQKRSEAVRDYLVKAGVARDRLVPQGFGETVPIASNRTEAGRAANRRVEFNIIDQNAPVNAAPKAPDAAAGKKKKGKKTK